MQKRVQSKRSIGLHFCKYGKFLVNFNENNNTYVESHLTDRIQSISSKCQLVKRKFCWHKMCQGSNWCKMVREVYTSQFIRKLCELCRSKVFYLPRFPHSKIIQLVFHKFHMKLRVIYCTAPAASEIF